MVITFLGKGFKTEEAKRAKYVFDKALSQKYKLKRANYTNMFPLIVDNFGDKEILPIYTKEAKETQLEVLTDEFSKDYSSLFNEKYFIEDTKDFASILKVLNSVINQERRYIIDLTHSFRHLPILATVSLISNHITDTSRVEHIFFAKEILPSTKDSIGEYEIIDLKEYLELANLSFMLTTFKHNYTVSGNMQFTNPLYQNIADELSDFSHHFLSNSLKPLIDGTLINDIVTNLKTLQQQESIRNFKNYIDDIILYIESIQALKDENEWMKLYKLSKIMDQRGYQLNAITLLFESVGFYCKNRIYKVSSTIKEHMDYFEQELLGKREPVTKYSLYTLVNQSRNIVKLSNVANKSDERFKGDYLYNPETINLTKSQYKRLKPKPKAKIKAIIDEIEQFVESCDDIDWFQDFIRDIENLRNNLAHGNSSQGIDDVKSSYQKMLRQYKTFCIEEDILKRVV
jgi:CRISPR-associated DxTHG motif protein